MPKFSLKEEISIFRRIKNINNLSKNDKIFSLLKNIRKKRISSIFYRLISIEKIQTDG